MTITDEVIELIDRDIAGHPPERGGLLFGPVGRDFITLFIPDEKALTTAVTYEISAEMCIKAPEIEKNTNLEYKGVVHSHPGSFNSPSTGDEVSAGNALRFNPHLPKFFMPIVTRHIEGTASAHETFLDKGTLSSYCAFRLRDATDRVQIKPQSVRIMPLKGDVRKFRDLLQNMGLQATMSETGTVLFQENVFQIAYFVTIGKSDIIIVGGEDYPHFAPNILITIGGGKTEATPVEWNVWDEQDSRLSSAVFATSRFKEIVSLSQQ